MNWDKTNDWLAMNWDRVRIGIGIVSALALLLVAGHLYTARADGLPARGAVASPLIPVADIAKAASWTGVSVGGYGAWINADADIPGLPITIGSTGGTAGATLSASLQMGQIVAEAFGDYGWFFGDLRDIGAETEMALGGRLGFLVNQNTLVYGLGAKSWVDTEGGTMDGWQYGGGVKVRFQSTPTVLSLEYRHSEYEASSALPIDITADSVRVGLTYQFNLR